MAQISFVKRSTESRMRSAWIYEETVKIGLDFRGKIGLSELYSFSSRGLRLAKIGFVLRLFQ
jgi:hypothetical protein